VAPTKQTTIPRLELCGAVLLMEIMVDVVDEITRMDIQVNQSNVMFWTDSTIVLAWIKSSQPLKSYVANYRICSFQLTGYSLALKSRYRYLTV